MVVMEVTQKAVGRCYEKIPTVGKLRDSPSCRRDLVELCGKPKLVGGNGDAISLARSPGSMWRKQGRD